MRLIDADALIGYLHTQFFYESRDRTRVYKAIQEQPTIKPERKKGKWYEDEDVGLCRCDQCNGVNLIHTPFCPMCGAKMEEDDDK